MIPETTDLFYPTILPNQEILFPSFAQCKALYDDFRQSSDLRKQSVARYMDLSDWARFGFCPVSNFYAVSRGDFDSPQIVTAYQSLIESSPVPTPPPSISFDDLLQGGA